MTDGVSQVTMADLHTDADLHDKPEDYLEIETGAGEDTVNLAAYGNFNIDTDSDSDFVQINSIAGQGNGNANTGTWVFGPATSSQDTFGDRVLYKAQLTVSFAGFESTVDVDTDSQGNFVADQMTVNEAIIAAIDANHELTDLLEYELGTDSQQLTIESVIGGANSLAIALYQPELVETDTADADLLDGQVKIASGDESALRQGLIDTTALTSADLEDDAEIAAATDGLDDFYGSIDQDGEGDEALYSDDELMHDVAQNLDDGTGDAAAVDIFDESAGNLYQDYDVGTSSDSNIGVNSSTIDVGDGDNDIVVMHANHDDSSNVLKISNDFGKVSVVNFHNVPTDQVNTMNEVSQHALDFTTYLDNDLDPSDVPENNDQSVEDIAVTLNIVAGAEAFSDSAPTSNEADANSVNVLRFDSTVDEDQTFADLGESTLLNALNNIDDDAGVDYGNLDYDLLSAADYGIADGDPDALVGTTQKHIVMVENDMNEGEYKVFYLESTIDDDGNVINADDEAGLFDSADMLGTLDFGASINFNLVGSEAYDEVLEDLLDAADGVVEDDTTAPTLVSSTPADDATDIAVADDIVLSFDEDVVAGTGVIALFDAAAPTTALASTVTFNGDNTVTIDPDADLAEGTDYFVRVQATAVEDAAGNAFAGFADPTALNFTTETTGGDTTAPTLVSSTPADDATDIAVADDIVLSFDEDVVAGTGVIALFDAAAPTTALASTVTFNGDNTVTIDPDADLAEGTDYFVRVQATAVEDVAGNAFAGFADPTVLNFTTLATGGGFDEIYTVTTADDGATLPADDLLSEQFDFQLQVEGDDGAIIRIDNFGADDQLKTNVAIDDDSYVFGTPAEDQIQLGFDWTALPDSYVVYLQGVDETLVDDVEAAIAAENTDQQIIDLIGTHEDFASDWLVVA
jgi:methionine-rich copper-binding protein CopC